MKIKNYFSVLLAVGACAPVALVARPVLAVEPSEVNPQSLQDLKDYLAKTEAADKLFNAKNYGEAATAFAAANALFVRAAKRDRSVKQLFITIEANEYPAMRYYGYGMGDNPVFQENVTGKWAAPADGFNAVMNQMWQDAAVLSGASRGPMCDTIDDVPSTVDLDKDHIDSMIRFIYGPVSRFEMPVPNEQLQSVLLQSRRAKLILEYALEKFPEWKTGETYWSRNNHSLNITGGAALADSIAKAKEAEPLYLKLVANFRAAEPKDFTFYKKHDLDELSGVLAGVKRDGYMTGSWFTALYAEKGFVASRRKQYAKYWTDQGKTMPASAMQPLEAKVAAIRAAVEAGAPKWKFPGGNHNALIESRSKMAVKNIFPDAVILKTAIDPDGWMIVKDDAQMPTNRVCAVLVLFKRPGQKWANLIYGNYSQDYAGGGTYNTAGKVSYPYIKARIQKAG